MRLIVDLSKAMLHDCFNGKIFLLLHFNNCCMKMSCPRVRVYFYVDQYAFLTLLLIFVAKSATIKNIIAIGNRML